MNRLLSTPEACELLHVSPAFLNYLISTKAIKAFNVGTQARPRWRVTRGFIAEYRAADLRRRRYWEDSLNTVERGSRLFV